MSRRRRRSSSLGYAGRAASFASRPRVSSVNERSPSAIARSSARRAQSGARPAARLPTGRTSRRPSLRVARPPARPDDPDVPTRRGMSRRWTIPIVVDGKPDAISGRLLHASGPPLWPWLVLLGATVVRCSALARCAERRTRRGALYVGAAIAGVAAAVLQPFVRLRARHAPPLQRGRTLVVCCRDRRRRARPVPARPGGRHAVAGFVGLLAALVGLSDASVLVHGFVISSLPAALVRSATAVAVSAAPSPPPARRSSFSETEVDTAHRPPEERSARRMAIPRGRTR